VHPCGQRQASFLGRKVRPKTGFAQGAPTPRGIGYCRLAGCQANGQRAARQKRNARIAGAKAKDQDGRRTGPVLSTEYDVFKSTKQRQRSAAQRKARAKGRAVELGGIKKGSRGITTMAATVPCRESRPWRIAFVMHHILCVTLTHHIEHLDPLASCSVPLCRFPR
jgi:hypothetical protein